MWLPPISTTTERYTAAQLSVRIAQISVENPQQVPQPSVKMAVITITKKKKERWEKIEKHTYAIFKTMLSLFKAVIRVLSKNSLG